MRDREKNSAKWKRRPRRFLRPWIATLALSLLLLSRIVAADSFSTGEITSLRCAIQDLAESFRKEYASYGDYTDRLNAIEKESARLDAKRGKKTADRERLTRDFRELQREALIANPLVSKYPLVFVARPQYKPDHHNTETMFQTNEINTASFQPGAALKIIDARSGQARVLTETSTGSLRDPDVYFDGRKVVFSMRRDITDDYHIYEVNADGTGLRQLTRAPGVTDIDPLYLPDDSIAFSSTREPKYCMCNRHIMANLYRMDGDGANIQQIGKSTLFEGHGSLMPDGRILYYRWEYVDRNFGDAQGLWTAYPDGTGHAVYWGNNTESPGAVFNAYAIPGTERALCVFGSCHDRPWGALAIVDRRLGLDLRAPVIRTWPADAIEKVGEGDANRFNIDTFTKVMPKYEDPYPLSDKYFLCSRMTGNGEEMGIYLLDVFGNEILVHGESPGCFDPMPLGPRPRPPVIPTRRGFQEKDGYFYVADVYRGTHMSGVPRGSVKYLRVVESPEKRFWTNPPWNGQGQEAPAMNWHDFNNKRILGTVPVEEDGSAYFAVPADTFVYFQLLDENGMMIQSMRSGTIVQAGERQGCVGCHEERRSTAPVASRNRIAAFRRPPSELTGWYGPPRLFSYMKEVQPVFDKYCVQCHDYGRDAAKKLNLAGDRDLVFNASYNELWRKKYIHVAGAGPAQIQPPYSWGSHASKIVEVMQKRRDELKIDAESLDRVITWVDINAPYYPEYASAYPANLAGRCPLNDAQIKRLTELTGVKFAEIMGFDQDQGPQVSFSRPECSPCLAKFADKNEPGFKEALDIIRAGREALAQRPRADMDGFVPCPLDQERERKYQQRKEAEIRNREAIAKGLKHYDE